jgi:putative transposase
MEVSMAGRIVASLELTTQQRQELNTLDRAHSTPQKLAERARIVLLAADGVSVSETARQLGIWRKTAGAWRRRWREADAAKSTAERLSDAPRSGAPGKFTPEQICAIIALTCEDPQASDLPLSQWSQSEVARQAVKRGIVASISHGSVGRFFKRISA